MPGRTAWYAPAYVWELYVYVTFLGFCELQHRLLRRLRDRVANGELTERGIARAVGISQPHIHNILKGNRAPSAGLCDTLLMRFHLSIEELAAGADGAEGVRKVSLVEGYIGPGHRWPDRVSNERLSVPFATVAGISSPIAARLACDPRMASYFSAGDVAILDQSLQARQMLAPTALYLVKFGGEGLIRRVNASEAGTYLYSADTEHQPSRWEPVSTNASSVLQTIRARVRLTTVIQDWS